MDINWIHKGIEHNVAEVREDIVKMVSGFLDYYDGYLRIPNWELMEKYQKVLSRDSMGEVKEIVDQSKAMLEATLAQIRKKWHRF